MGCCNFKKYSTHQCTKMSRRENICFLTKLSKSSEIYFLEPSLYSTITDILEVMIPLIQERQNHSENCITVKVSRREKVVIYLVIERLGLAFLNTDLVAILAMNLE